MSTKTLVLLTNGTFWDSFVCINNTVAETRVDIITRARINPINFIQKLLSSSLDKNKTLILYNNSMFTFN